MKKTSILKGDRKPIQSQEKRGTRKSARKLTSESKVAEGVGKTEEEKESNAKKARAVFMGNRLIALLLCQSGNRNSLAAKLTKMILHLFGFQLFFATPVIKKLKSKDGTCKSFVWTLVLFFISTYF